MQAIQQIKANFVLQGTTLSRFCLSNNIDPSNAMKALRGTWKGEKATAICELITHASGVVSSEAITHASGE